MRRKFIYLLFIFSVFILSNCAKELSPTGGPVDIYPPMVSSVSTPSQSTNFTEDEVVITFNEYIKLKNLTKELIVSPPISPPPTITSKSKKVFIDFSKCNLAVNTTYTLNFGNSIVDYNEENILRNYNYVFSTGNTIDSLSFSGSAFNSQSGEPIFNLAAHLYKSNSDTAFLHATPNYVVRTDSSGRFTFNNLPSDSFQLLVLDDKNDNHFPDRDELVGSSFDYVFPTISSSLHDPVSLFPYSPLFTDLIITDTIGVNNQFIRFVFNKKLSPSITDNLVFKSATDTFSPTVSTVQDTLNVFLSDSTITNFTAVYNDSTLVNDLNTRSLSSIPFKPTLSLQKAHYHTNDTLIFYFNYPISSISPDSFKIFKDTILLKKTPAVFLFDSFTFGLNTNFKEGNKYTIIPSVNTLSSSYLSEQYSSEDTFNIYIKGDDNFGSIYCNFSFDSAFLNLNPLVLLTKKDEVIRTAPLKTKTLNFKYLIQDEYKIKIVLDSNNDGRWTTGELQKQNQPERIIFFNDPISVRANWDLELNFNLK